MMGPKRFFLLHLASFLAAGIYGIILQSSWERKVDDFYIFEIAVIDTEDKTVELFSISTEGTYISPSETYLNFLTKFAVILSHETSDCYIMSIDTLMFESVKSKLLNYNNTVLNETTTVIFGMTNDFSSNIILQNNFPLNCSASSTYGVTLKSSGAILSEKNVTVLGEFSLMDATLFLVDKLTT